MASKKISIFGLVLTYDASDGSFTLVEEDFAESSLHFIDLDERLKGNSYFHHVELEMYGGQQRLNLIERI